MRLCNAVNPGPKSDDPASSQQPFGAAPSGNGPPAAAAGPASDHTKYPFYNVRRYRDLFDVDTTASRGVFRVFCNALRSMEVTAVPRLHAAGDLDACQTACAQDVLWRVGNSLIGVFRPNFMEVTMKSPDL